MPDTEFVERLASLIDRERLPETADVWRVRQVSEQENEQRLEALTNALRQLSDRLHLSDHIAQGESLEFERLWRIKACATDREGHSTDPVLCRAVGAFRHVVGGLPVWGAASAVVRAAAHGQLDKVEVHARHTVPGPVDRVKVLPPEEAAVLVLRQLSGLQPGGEREFGDQAQPVSFQLGYFALGKRKSQPYLAPAYVALVEVQGENEGEPEGRLGHVAVVGGAEKDYLQFARFGAEPQGIGHRESE